MTAEQPAWVIEQSLDPSAFQCCGDQDLLPFQCAGCRRPLVLCYECDTLYAHLPDTTRQEPFSSVAAVCPGCRQPFAPGFQRDPRYRIGFDQWRAAGLGALLGEASMEELAAMLVGSADQLLGLLERHMLSTARLRLWELRNLGEAIAPRFTAAALRRAEAREKNPPHQLADLIRWSRRLSDPLERAYATLGVADVAFPDEP